jgi:hypothetical protein
MEPLSAKPQAGGLPLVGFPRMLIQSAILRICWLSPLVTLGNSDPQYMDFLSLQEFILMNT